MKLRTSPASPFGRKVKIAASLLGLGDRIEVIQTDTNDPDDPLRRDNPLGKIPTLVTETGEAYYDSRVILEYLDHLAGGDRIIPAGEARFAALREQALADGIMDAALLQVYEGRFREEHRHEPKWLEMQAGKVTRGLAYAEAHHAAWPAAIHVGHIALACALGYLDLRFAGTWRETHPALVVWLDRFEREVPAFAKTRFTP